MKMGFGEEDSEKMWRGRSNCHSGGVVKYRLWKPRPLDAVPLGDANDTKHSRDWCRRHATGDKRRRLSQSKRSAPFCRKHLKGNIRGSRWTFRSGCKLVRKPLMSRIESRSFRGVIPTGSGRNLVFWCAISENPPPLPFYIARTFEKFWFPHVGSPFFSTVS